MVRNERGFALPVTILLVALLTVLLSAGFTRVRAELEITESTDQVALALAVAQSGLHTYMGTLNVDTCSRPLRPADGDSLRINVTGGYTEVVARVVQRPLDTLANWTYLIRSTGYAINPLEGSTPTARRTVTQFAEWQSGQLTFEAAFTAANGLDDEDNGTGEFRGEDGNWPVICRDPDKYAIRVPAGQAPLIPGYTTTGLSPNVAEWSTPSDVTLGTNVDWFATINSGIVPDYTSVQNWDWNYPLVYIAGDATVGSLGSTTTSTGLLIVTGDLRILGNFFQFYGVVLVGGRVIFDADDQRFDGYLASGLNEQLGINVSDTDIGAGNDYTDVDFNSAHIRLAMQALAGWAPMANAWIDNWATY
jgi:hypothetical protein